MHRALLVSELLSLIFVYVEEHDRRTLALSSRGTLARCARTCKAWHGPATRILWHTIDSLLPLLQLFPRDAFSNLSRLFPRDIFSNLSRKEPGLWRFKRTLRPVDWEAFTRYAPLIRSLSFREGRDVVPSSIVALDMQRPARYRCAPLLPNLTTLKWTVSVSSTLTLCIPLVSPSLKSLLIHVVGAEAPAAERNDAAGGLLCTLVDIAPEITEVNLNIDKLWTVGDVVNPLIALAHLQVLKLDVGSIGPFILRGLCQHQSLARLEIDLRGIDESFLGHLADHSPRPDEFPALKELNITADMHIVNMTLSLLLRAPLTSIAISTFTLIHPNALSSALSILSQTSPHLRELRIATSFTGGSIKSFESTVSLEATHPDITPLLPILTLKHLEVVSFHLFYPVRLEDAEVAMMLGALPNLKEFTMNPAPEWAPPKWKPVATMQSLKWLAMNAKGLKSFGLAIDYGAPCTTTTTTASELEMSQRLLDATENGGVIAGGSLTPPLTPESSIVLEGPKPVVPVNKGPSGLEILSLGASFIPAGEENAVAECLATLFPCLQVLRPPSSDALCARSGSCEDDGDGDGDGGVIMKERWDRVEHCIRMRRGDGGGGHGHGHYAGSSGRALAGSSHTRQRKRTLLVFDDMEMEDCGEDRGPDADDYEWGLALHQTV